MEERYVELTKLVEKLAFKNLTPNIDLSGIRIYKASVTRPSLQFAGYFEYTDPQRIHLVGRGESEYIKTIPEEIRKERYDKMFSVGFPAIIISRGIMPEQIFLDAANKYGIPVLSSELETSMLIVEVIPFLSEGLSPTDSIYGVLVDVYGEGIVITGESGVGKSETALELIKRGHRIVADDIIEVYKRGDDTLIGKAPELTEHLIELRGIGVLDAMALFGIESVRENKQIDMIINLEEWDDDKNYDRLGLEDEYQEILGVPVVKHSVPVRPGRNLAIIVETAAVNNRQKKMGYNAAQTLRDKLAETISTKENKTEDKI